MPLDFLYSSRHPSKAKQHPEWFLPRDVALRKNKHVLFTTYRERHNLLELDLTTLWELSNLGNILFWQVVSHSITYNFKDKYLTNMHKNFSLVLEPEIAFNEVNFKNHLHKLLKSSFLPQKLRIYLSFHLRYKSQSNFFQRKENYWSPVENRRALANG